MLTTSSEPDGLKKLPVKPQWNHNQSWSAETTDRSTNPLTFRALPQRSYIKNPTTTNWLRLRVEDLDFGTNFLPFLVFLHYPCWIPSQTKKVDQGEIG